jgi:hypothetical protein
MASSNCVCLNFLFSGNGAFFRRFGDHEKLIKDFCDDTGMALNLAYKYVAMILMLAEANFFCEKADIPGERPLTRGHVRSGSHVAPPSLKDFGGSILTDQYFFGFHWGHLANFHKREFMPQSPDSAIRERNLELAKLSSLIDTNGAYELATNWLAVVGINVPAMEARYRRNVFQWQYYPTGKDGPTLVLPVYQVEWRGFILKTQTNRERPVVSVTIFGATKELVDYQVLDESLFLHPPIKIRDSQGLLSIPDSEFMKYTLLQKSNLVFGSMSTNYAGYSIAELQQMKSLDGTNSVNSTAPSISRRKLKVVPPGEEPKNKPQ